MNNGLKLGVSCNFSCEYKEPVHIFCSKLLSQLSGKQKQEKQCQFEYFFESAIFFLLQNLCQ